MGRKRGKRMPITQEQALELADKYLLYSTKFALKDNISVSRVARGWRIVAKTTPVIFGMQIEITTFTIDAETGEVGASITIPVKITDVLKEIDERKDLDELKKEQIKEKVREFEEEVMENPPDGNMLNDFKKWFENNASFLESIINLITTILQTIRGIGSST